MSTEVVTIASHPAEVTSRRGRPEVAIARRTFRQLWISATVVGVAFGATVAATAMSYANSYPTAASRLAIAATTRADRGLAVLLGPVGDVGTVGGYTVYKDFAFLASIGAIWALLAATRVLRGEEDAGRWQLVLAAGTRPGRAVAAAAAGLAGAVTTVLVATTLIALLAGRDSSLGFTVPGTLLYGLSLASAPAVFGALGILTSQLAGSRRLADVMGIVAFGLAYLVRMIADSGSATHWLLWTTPLGWIELMRPFTTNDAWPLLPTAVTVVGLCAAGIVIAGHRDVGDGLWSTRDVSPVRPRGLGSSLGLASRLELPMLVAWSVGAAAAGFALGLIAKITTAKPPQSLGDTLRHFGVHGAFVDQYLGVAFLLVAILVALIPAAQLGAAAGEELSGRLVHELTRSTRRASWIGGRLALAAVGIAAAGVIAGAATWAGASSQGVDLGFGRLVGAGLNVIPTALVALGIGAVVLALWPRAAAATVYVVVIWSGIVDLLGSLVTGADWLGHLSLFHYLALAPAQAVDAVTIVVTTAVAAALCLAAIALFVRRDLSTG
jgi:ABC-2 type transport system permease protein